MRGGARGAGAGRPGAGAGARTRRAPRAELRRQGARLPVGPGGVRVQRVLGEGSYGLVGPLHPPCTPPAASG